MSCPRLWIRSRLKCFLLFWMFFGVALLLVTRLIYLFDDGGGEATDIFRSTIYAVKHENSSAEEKFLNETWVSETTWQHPLCGCNRSSINFQPNFAVGTVINSTCGPSADRRGSGQKVVSYSFYGDTGSGYFTGAESSATSISAMYHGWTMRLYHDISPEDPTGSENLCKLVCKHAILDDCYVGNLKIGIGSAGNLLDKFGMIWRFAVMGDPTVDLFAIRDLDSPIHQREVDAVDDWIRDGSTFHIMRDNPVHYARIMGGMWGGNNRHGSAKMQLLREELFSRPNEKFKAYDQDLLAEIVWPEAAKNVTAHDSYLCGMFENTKPWPTRRVGRTFVGDMYGISIAKRCPPKCRPPDHQDWIYC